MQTTSDQDVDFANQLVTPFFTRAQIAVFDIPPPRNVIKEVKKGGKKQQYLPHLYIRALLNRYIGPSRYDITAELHSLEREIVQKFDPTTKEEYESVAVTAISDVCLTIYAADGSGKSLKFSATGSNTQYAKAKLGYGTIAANAISSAESAGLKTAAKNLGKAFGFDLGATLDPAKMPMNVSEMAKMINARHAERQNLLQVEGNVQDAPAGGNAQSQNPESGHAPPIASAQDNGHNQLATQTHPAQSRQTSPSPANSPASPQPEAANQNENSRDAQRSGPGQQATDNRPASAANHNSPQDGTNGPAASHDNGSPSNWELSVIPSSYQEWITCIRTMAQRVNAMTNEREIENFVRRHQKLIKPLPCYPAADGKEEKDFRKRWNTILFKRYEELGLTPPEDIQKALAKAA